MGRIIWLGLVLVVISTFGMWALPPGSENGGKAADLPVESLKLPEMTESALQLPCEPENWSLVVEKSFGYDGPYIEDGSCEPVSNVAGVILHNAGQRGISFAVVALEQGEKTTYYSVTWLPAGERVLVLDMERKEFTDAPITGCRVLGIRWDDFSSAPVEIERLVDNGVEVTNLTQETLTGVRLRYKWYLEDYGIYFGGITQCLILPTLSAEERLIAFPETYGADAIRVVAKIK